ncbi:MAG: ECF transporter S component [Actinomycetaceae bacterium]|nr:ECF transporter S component [Actinomycetaceae bacterium]
MVVAAVLSVAVGLIFYGWNTIGYAGYEAVNALTPGLGGLFNGVWFLGGTLRAIIIRKPGTAYL